MKKEYEEKMKKKKEKEEKKKKEENDGDKDKDKDKDAKDTTKSDDKKAKVRIDRLISIDPSNIVIGERIGIGTRRSPKSL